MITPEQFAQTSSLWVQVLPMMDSLSRAANSESARYCEPIRSRAAQDRNPLIAETAFINARQRRVGRKESISEGEARSFIRNLKGGRAARRVLNYVEREEVEGLTRNILEGLNEFEEVSFGRRVAGCGPVSASFVDAIGDHSLIEVKSVQRMFLTRDIRQVLTYACLLRLDGVPISQAILLNPRRGIRYVVAISDLAARGSGVSASTLLDQIADLMMGLQVSQ